MDPIFQGAHWPLGPSLLSASIPPPGLLSPACPPEAPLPPPSQFLEAPFAPRVGSPTPYPPSVRSISRSPGDSLSGGPVPGMFLFPSERPRAPFSPPGSHLCTPPARPDATHHRTGYPPSRDPCLPQTQPPGATRVAQLTTWNQGAGLHPGAPMRCGSAGVSLGARSLYEQNGRSFRLCTADNRGRRLSPKTFSPKELISCLAGVCASPGPGGYSPQSLILFAPTSS